MKKRLLIASGIIAAVAIAIAGWNPFVSPEKTAVYKPRVNHANMHSGAQGWIDYMTEIKKNYYTGRIEVEDILATRRALDKFSAGRTKSNAMEWNSLGPDNIGGRTRALWLDPEDNNHLIGGAATGGLWETFNGGVSWGPIESFNKHPEFYQQMPIGSIARTGSGIYYVGTGSQHENQNPSGAGTAGFIGGGLFRSTDASGSDWELVFGPDQLFSTNESWLTVDAVVVDPNNPEKMWIAHSGGLDVYIHGNDDLEPRPSGIPGTAVACEDVHVSADGSVIVASINNRGYISTDGGQDFDAIQGSLANGGVNVLGSGGNNRIEFAIAPSDPSYIYASVVNTNGSLRGVFATFDTGASWYRIAVDVNDSGSEPATFQPFGGVGGQGRWDNALIVNPLNPKQIFLGGLVIYSHTIVGNTPAITNWEQRSLYSLDYTNPFSVHPDIHYFLWEDDNTFWACTDGGFFKSDLMATSPVPTFYPVNQGFVTTQFYGIAHANDNRTIGGTQDNGTLYQNQQGTTPNEGVIVFGGDGFDAEISFIRPNLIFGSSQFGNISRSLGGGFAEPISPPGGSSDFTTNLRLVEVENDPFSRRGKLWGVDTLLAAFVPEITEWPNGDITLGFVPQGYWISHTSDTDQRQLWTQTQEDMYYYAQRILIDTTFFTVIDTVDIVEELTTIDTLFFPIDTTITEICDIFNVPVDTTFTDSCVVFLGEIFCVHIDTTVVFADTLLCFPEDTIITFDSQFVYDTTITYIIEENTEFTIQIDTVFGTADSIFLIDPVQSLFVVAYGQGNGIWVTRDALNTSIDPEWWNVSSTTEMVNSLEWSPDRNHLYIGTLGGQLIRISGFNDVYYGDELDNLTSQILISGGPPINNIAVDYSLGTGGPDGTEPVSEMVVVARSTYGPQDKVLRSFTAASATTANTFSNIWNLPSPLDRMPVYSCVINKENPEVIVVGTEVGIFRTDDGGDTWEEANGGLMDRVATLDLRQQYREAWEVENSGMIYAGTHGRGIFDNGDFFSPNTSVNDVNDAINESVPALSNLNVFPNPMNTQGWAEFTLNQPGTVRMVVFGINGQMMAQIQRDNLPTGTQQIGFDASRLTAGTYLLVLESGGVRETKRFIVTK